LRREFRTPLNLFIPAKLETRPRSELVDFLKPIPFNEIEQDMVMRESLAHLIYRSVAPLLKQITWIQKDEIIDPAVKITQKRLELAKRAAAILQSNPKRLTAERVVNLVTIIAPRRVQAKRESLDMLLELQRLTLDQRSEIIEKLSILDQGLQAEEQEKKPVVPQKKAAGFHSRVGALFKKRKKRRKASKKNKKNKSKPKKKAPKKPLVVKVLNPDFSETETIRSPRIKAKKAGAVRFTDFVHKKKKKRYLN